MEVPETKLDPKISKRVTKSDVANKLKERDKIQKRIDQITTELERLHPGRRR
jgi:hypothetical protein